jgi:tetratricopeptide (TPR) repeat protein
VCEKHPSVSKKTATLQKALRFWSLQLCAFLAGVALWSSTIHAQEQRPEWQAEVRKQAEAQDWDSAMKIVDRQVARDPRNMDVRAWRARVLMWSGHLADAEKEYLEVLQFARSDPDNWMGLASVYLREGRVEEALRMLSRAVELAPQRADLRAARARTLRTMGERNEARMEFQKALNLDPTSMEAKAGLISVRGEPRHELRFGQDNDLFNFTGANRAGWLSLLSQWTPHWATRFAGNFYERSGIRAGKFSGAITGHLQRWGSLTAGGAAGHDNGVIPKSEAFFEIDHGWKFNEPTYLRAVEFVCGQHWYWYQASRILTLNGATIAYFPLDFTVSLSATGARSSFSGTGAEWRPSGVARLGFPLAGWGEKRLSGNIFFAAGTENFAQIDQLGRFASQSYGGGLRLQIKARQDFTGYASYQKRTQGRTNTSFGLSYAIHF